MTERRKGDERPAASVVPSFRLSVVVLVLLSACQPQATRLLLLDLALSEPSVLNSTARPWREEGYRVEYRRFYPHLARADMERYGTLIFLLGREPEAPSDALNTGDLALLTEWVSRGSVVVLAYDADGEGYLDRWTANRWLEFVGAGISIGDRLLEDTTGRVPTTTGHPQPWAEARAVGDEPLGSVYDPFPLERNNVVSARDTAQLLAVTSRHAFVRAPRTPSGRAGAGVAAAARVGDGLVIVISRHALGTLGAQFRPTTAPVLQLDALARTHAFLTALARWTRRPAEWAHIAPAAHAAPLLLTQAPVPVEIASPPAAPPREVDTTSLPIEADPKLARATSIPDWMRQQGMRVLWAPLLATREGRRAVRSSASLDSLVSLLDAGGFNLLAGDAAPESTDSLHTRWDEREAVRRAWADAAKRLQPTSVAWIPVLDLGAARHAVADSSRGARGEGLPMPCALDSTLWTDGLPSAYSALGRLATDQRTLVIAIGLDLAGPHVYSMGQDFCDAAWRRGLAGLARGGQGDLRLDSLPYPARYAALRDAGLLPRYYRALEDEVAARATVLRDRVLKQRRDLYFAFRLAQPPTDWFTLGLLRGFELPDRPILLFTPEVRARELVALHRADGLNLAHAVALAPSFLRARDATSVKQLVFTESDGFWVPADEPAGAGAWWRLPYDSLGRLLRRMTR
ncbi:MAG TPA: hypothetical protein VEU73_07675 [Gemmatimonadales bacterium]|nr:hypothetical protein [Gemmatimonadales bacterium]